MLWGGFLLVLIGAAIGFSGDELKRSGETLYFRFAFELMEVGLIAAGVLSGENQILYSRA